MRDKLGHKAMDTISGFEGVITGHCSYLTGCNQVLLGGKSNDGKPGESGWFDEQRIKIDQSVPAIVLDNSKTPGFDTAAPIR